GGVLVARRGGEVEDCVAEECARALLVALPEQVGGLRADDRAVLGELERLRRLERVVEQGQRLLLKLLLRLLPLLFRLLAELRQLRFLVELRQLRRGVREHEQREGERHEGRSERHSLLLPK